MKIVTVLCGSCDCFFRMEAFDEGDLKEPICDLCREAKCNHDHVRFVRFDAGRCMDTGYVDAGEVWICDDCGYEEVA